MAGTIALVGTLTEALSSVVHPEIPDAVAMLQVRGGLGENQPAEWLRPRFAGELLYSWPYPGESGQLAAPFAARHRALIQAAREFDLIELDVDCDLSPELLAAIPAHRRLISWRGKGRDLAGLRSIFARMSAVRARFYSIVTQGSYTNDGVIPLLLLKELGRNDVIAFCEGAAAFWSRILSPQFGARLLFGQLEQNPVSQSGEPSIRQLMEDYGFPDVHPVRQLYGMVGNRVFQSPSPRLHNAGYRSLGHSALYLPFHVECFEDFWQETIQSAALERLGLSLRGLTIVSPYKEAAAAAAARCSPIAGRAGASNLFLRKNGCWEAHTTDPESIAGIAGNGHRPSKPLHAAVVGCGGAGRAIAAALQQSGAHVTLVNRGHERGELAVKLLSLPFVPLSDFTAGGFSLLVNATPVGRDDDCMPFAIDSLGSSATVVDLAYGARPTPLATGVAARGSSVVDGYDVLVNQVRRQFQMMTGLEMPPDIGRHTATPQTFLQSACERQRIA